MAEPVLMEAAKKKPGRKKGVPTTPPALIEMDKKQYVVLWNTATTRRVKSYENADEAHAAAQKLADRGTSAMVLVSEAAYRKPQVSRTDF